MSRIAAIALVELRIARRNRWLLMATLVLMLFALALSFAGSAPTGTLGVDLLTVAVASMTTLSVYLAPLIALMLAFDAISGEAERGSLTLLLSYPVSRGQILAGKFAAHLVVLAVATAVGFGAAGVAAAAVGGAGADSLAALAALIGSSVLLGAVFLALGYAISAVAGSTAGAAGLAAGVWLVLVVLWDLGLLGAVVLDDGGRFTREIFPWLLVLNPADTFRLWNVGFSDAVALAGGMAGAVDAVPRLAVTASILLWPLAALGIARFAIGRVEP